jgi:Uma2 family endonuclease
MPADMLAERHALGLDKRDEVWEGGYHMVPPSSNDHQGIGARLLVAMAPHAAAAGLEIRYEVGLTDPEVADWSDFRVPDLVLFRSEHGSSRAVEGRGELVVEIRSPNDDSLKKLGFYGRVGVAEMVLIERDTRHIRRWVNTGATLVETAPDSDGWHHLAAIPFRLRGRDATLEAGPGDAPSRLWPPP